MKALSIVVLAVVALAFAEDAKEAKDFKVVSPYAFPAFGYGYAGAFNGYYGYATPYAAAYPAEKFFTAPAVKYTAPAAYPYAAYPYAGYPYAAYPYAAAPAVSSYSLKLDDSKEPAAYLPGAFPYGGYGYGFGYPYSFVTKKE